MSGERGEAPRSPLLDVRLYVPSVVLLVLGAWAYMDLRSRLDDAAPEEPSAAEMPQQSSMGVPTVSGEPVPATPPAPPCLGTLEPEAIRQVVGQNGPVVFECHARHAADRAGSLVLELRVSESGVVETSTARGDLASHRALMDCIYDDIETWPFPPPAGGCTIVEIPFTLATADASEPASPNP